MTAQCWLHPVGEEHDVVLLEGWFDGATGEVIPADMRCAREHGRHDDWRRLPADRINVGSVRT